MYFLLILFFGSFFGITFMIGNKLLMLQNGQIKYEENTETFLKAQHLEELKHSVIKTIKKHSYAGLVTTIRLYFRGIFFIKNKYQKIKIKIKDIYRKNPIKDFENKQEISKFLKIISEYKQKIRAIKHKIEEEENL
ncbi:MAG: hypothetical protein WCW93_02380 [Candidatus Paceibacterota bacterium]